QVGCSKALTGDKSEWKGLLMRLFHIAASTAAAILLLLGAGPSQASSIPTRGASNYGGDAGGFNGCADSIGTFLKTGDAFKCEGFVSGVSRMGGNTYNGAEFAFLESGGTAFGILDVLQFGSNSPLNLNLLSGALPTGVFLCNNPDDPGTATASNE